MTTTLRRVGMIGLGKMGNPMCRHLKKAGFEVTGTDINEAARCNLKRPASGRLQPPAR
jgi:3-hydroxyisobutyrate dehydrogenase-like beta-hydroxyacid dehydrogenase